MNQNPVEEGQKFPLTIRRMGINGEGIGYFKKQLYLYLAQLPVKK